MNPFCLCDLRRSFKTYLAVFAIDRGLLDGYNPTYYTGGLYAMDGFNLDLFNRGFL
jgi:hypothetical protein